MRGCLVTMYVQIKPAEPTEFVMSSGKTLEHRHETSAADIYRSAFIVCMSLW